VRVATAGGAGRAAVPELVALRRQQPLHPPSLPTHPATQGVDMTPAQLEVARRHEAAWARELGYASPNTRFVEGAIEDLEGAGVAAGSVDVAISK
jgi:hypothetical protein